MALAAGFRLGPYEILAPLGSGGMGEVYRARDTRLDRTVAIKVLPPHLASDPQFRERFDREAHAIAALNHPHICTLHDVGNHEGVAFLVMEYLEGETLAARLENGAALPLERTLGFAVEIADALDKAHRAGIVHRDVKPGNIMLTQAGVKMLDFGLAKATAPEMANAGLSSLPTAPADLTAHGTILGTLQYMAPEQLEGHDADSRSDIFAFGAVVYEMMTGKKAFEGRSKANLVAAILERDPAPPSTLQPLTPPAVDRVLSRCLAKDPEARWQDARDLADELRWLMTRPEVANATTGPAHASSSLRARVAWGLGLATLLLGTILVGILKWPSSAQAPARSVQRTVLQVGGAGIELAGAVVISPDGRFIAFIGQDSAGSRLYVRRLDQWDAHALDNTEGALPEMSFSPDSEWIAFIGTRRQLRKVSVSGGAAQLICSAEGAGASGAIRWVPDGRTDGRILFTRPTGIWSVAAAGGVPQVVVQAQDTGRPGRYMWPEALPGGQTILFTIVEEGRATIAAFSLQSRKLIPLIESAIRPRYLPETGHLIYQSGAQLLAAPFDPGRLVLTGEAHVIADRVGDGVMSDAEYDISRNGVLAYLPPYTARLVWKDRAGVTTPLPMKPRRYDFVTLSADGSRAVLGVREGAAHRLYSANLKSGEPLTHLTPGNDDHFGLFTRDGRRVLFTSGEGGRYNIFSTRADGGGETARLTDSPHWQRPTSISSRSPVLLLNDIEEQPDIRQLQLDRPGGAALPLVKTPEPESNAVFSPDGQWIAYQQATSGERQEVYVQGYPKGSKTQVSQDGGSNPAWNPMGGELFYMSANRLIAMRIANGTPVGQPVRLLERRPGLSYPYPDWAVSPDGLRFLMVEGARIPQINIVSNLFEELKQRVPVK
jgi:serine/threonine-protein kinase